MGVAGIAVAVAAVALLSNGQGGAEPGAAESARQALPTDSVPRAIDTAAIAAAERARVDSVARADSAAAIALADSAASADSVARTAESAGAVVTKPRVNTDSIRVVRADSLRILADMSYNSTLGLTVGQTVQLSVRPYHATVQGDKLDAGKYRLTSADPTRLQVTPGNRLVAKQAGPPVRVTVQAFGVRWFRDFPIREGPGVTRGEGGDTATSKGRRSEPITLERARELIQVDFEPHLAQKHMENLRGLFRPAGEEAVEGWIRYIQSMPGLKIKSITYDAVPGTPAVPTVDLRVSLSWRKVGKDGKWFNLQDQRTIPFRATFTHDSGEWQVRSVVPREPAPQPLK
jgi:hypothetical protein